MTTIIEAGFNEMLWGKLMLGRIAWIAAMLAMLSACAGTGNPANPYARSDHRDIHESQASYYEDDDQEASTERLTEDRYRADDRYAARHYHNEPSHHDYYAGQLALAISAQVFACAFFVVILDGSCQFYASTGYYY